jgi:ankyrin repeat protein
MASIHSAAYNGNVNRVRALLNSGTNVNARGVTGITPLHYAAGHGFLPMVKLLLVRGANINARDKYGITPLILAAAQKCNLAVIRELLDRGANINARNKENFSASTSILCAQCIQLPWPPWISNKGSPEASPYCRQLTW